MRFGPALLIAFLIALTSVAAHATFWDVEPVYGGGFAAGDTSVAVDSSSVPSISYTANGALCLATKSTGGAWTSQTVAQVGFWGGWSSLAFNGSNQPCVAYVDTSSFTTNCLKFGYKAGANWTVETIEDIGWTQDYVSLGFNSSGQACVAYCKTTGTYPNTHSFICLAQRTGPNAWAKASIVEVGGETGPSLAVSGSTYYVSFADSANGQLRVATKTGAAAWQIETVDGGLSSPIVWYTSAAVKADGSPAIGYFQSSSGSTLLTYAHRTGQTWARETAASMTGSGVAYCSVGITPWGIPLIAYYDVESDSFKHAWKTGGRWYSEIVDASPQAGLRSSLKIDSTGSVNASWFDGAAGNVKFASALYPRSLAEVKSLPDGVYQISGPIATCAGSELSQMVYAQEADRSCGIQLYFPTTGPTVSRGMILDVQGQVATVGQERAIYDPLVDDLGSDIEPKPLGVSGRSLGGGGYAYHAGPPATGQKGVYGASGLNNVGLLVTTWGKVTYAGSGYFYLDDGSQLDDASGHAGEKVQATGLTLPSVGKYVRVAGISSVFQSGSQLRRLIRARRQDDITTLN